MEISFLFLLIRCDDVVPRMAANLKRVLQGGDFKERRWRACRHEQERFMSFSSWEDLHHSLTKFILSWYIRILYEVPLMKNYYVQGNKIQSEKKSVTQRAGSW